MIAVAACRRIAAETLAPPAAPAYESSPPAVGVGARTAAPGARRKHLETQRASAGHGLHQAHAHGVAQPVDVAGAIADQGVQGLVVAVVVVERGGRYEAVGTRVVQA